MGADRSCGALCYLTKLGLELLLGPPMLEMYALMLL